VADQGAAAGRDAGSQRKLERTEEREKREKRRER